MGVLTAVSNVGCILFRILTSGLEQCVKKATKARHNSNLAPQEESAQKTASPRRPDPEGGQGREGTRQGAGPIPGTPHDGP